MELKKILFESMSYPRDCLANQTAVVTGAAEGIGRQIVIGLALLGARVVIIDRQKEKSEKTCNLILNMGNKARFIHVDIARDGHLIKALDRIRQENGEIDILVNNAMKCFIGSYGEETQETWDAIFDINLRYPVAGIRRVLPGMLEQRSGVIANIISLEGLTAATAYSASKVAMRSVSSSISSEIGNESGVSVFAFAPGIVETKTVTNYFYPELAKRYGMTLQDIIEGIGGNPGYSGLMPVEHCAAGFVDCVVNAQQYHGQIVGPFLSLARAGVIHFEEEPESELDNGTVLSIKGLDVVNRNVKDYLTSVTEINRNLEHRINVRTAELEAALDEVRKKNTLIEETNNKLIDSIRYAERIQKALLPEKEEIRKYLPESCIIWEPRDIVGGDFYQLYPFGDSLFLVVGDCTGHGVPGGFMTMMVLTMLNAIIYGSPTRNPAAILNMLNSTLKVALKQDRDVSKLDDGLDIAVCYIDIERQEIEYAGARFPLIQVVDGEAQIVKADRKSLGYRRTSLDSKFTTKKLDVTPDSVFYLVSDGLTDQLGGSNNLAFGKRALTELLTSVHQSPMDIQKETILKALQAHQGKRDRQDDIVLFGFKVPTELLL